MRSIRWMRTRIGLETGRVRFNDASDVKIARGTGIRRRISGAIQHTHKLGSIGTPIHTMTNRIWVASERDFRIRFERSGLKTTRI